MSASDRHLRAVAAGLMLLLAAPGLRAETILTPEEFDALSVGKTLSYAQDGQIYGREMHFPGRQVRIAIPGRECGKGTWFARGTEICFVYEGLPNEHCWTFRRDGDRLLAHGSAANGDSPPSEVTLSDAPLSCPGPDVGV
ncbi:MAG: hypothetical protein HC844_17380 [Tabrizicola sp.]|nr:hypothetical protein [Tabrizicola sp.]